MAARMGSVVRKQEAGLAGLWVREARAEESVRVAEARHQPRRRPEKRRSAATSVLRRAEAFHCPSRVLELSRF